MKAWLDRLRAGEVFSRPDARAVMGSILDDASSADDIGAFLSELHRRGESPEEIAGFLDGMRSRAIAVPLELPGLMDCCGTGGDGAGTFNISTASAFVLAAGGVPVAKHGNRSVSSRSGSADVLEALGVPTNLSPTDAAKSILKTGFAFLFAPQYHPALARVGPIRKKLGTRTIFNFIGPLANPARLERQLVGISEPRLLEKYAAALQGLGLKEALVVCSEDGLDEFSLSAPAQVARLSHGKIALETLKPADFGVSEAPRDSVRGGDARENAAILEEVLAGATPGPRTDIVVMNAGAGFWVSGLAGTPRDGVERARAVLRAGRAKKLLDELRIPRGAA